MSKQTVIVVAVLVLLSISVFAITPKSIVVKQPNSPVSIDSYSGKYKSGDTYGKGKGIQHKVSYSNASNRTIVAIRLGFVSFDIWNEKLDKTGGITIEKIPPGKTDKGTWVTRSYGSFTFLTGVAYVDRVRFEDGEIWKSDPDLIVEEIQNIQEDFEASQLEESAEK